MFALAWISLFPLLLVQVGLVYSLLVKPKTNTLSEVFINSGYGLATIILTLFALNVVIPVQWILQPITYLFLLGASVYALVKLKPKIDQVSLIALGLYIFFSIFVFQQEIQLNARVSFGGNGDYFNQERLVQYTTLFSRLAHPTVNIAYAETQWRMGKNYHYPIGATYLLSFFGRAISQIISTPLVTTYHKLFVSYALLLSFIVTYKWKKNIVLSLLVNLFIFTLPILHSVIGMDFVPHEAVLGFIILLFSKTLLKQFDWEMVLLFAAICVTYYFALFPLLFFVLYLFILLFRQKKYRILFALCCIAIASLGYYFVNIHDVQSELQPGGIGIKFPLIELSSAIPIIYNPAHIPQLPYPFDNVIRPATLVFCFVALIFLSMKYQLRSFQKIKWLGIFSGDGTGLLLFSILSVTLGLVYYFFAKPYHSYKFFSFFPIIFLLPITYWFEKLYIAMKKSELSRQFLCILLTCLFVTNVFESYKYNVTWVREHAIHLYESSNYQLVKRSVKNGTLVLHRNVYFKSLLGVEVPPEVTIYIDGYYFTSYQNAQNPNSSENYDDLTQYNPNLVTQVISDELSRDQLDKPYDQISNTSIFIFPLQSVKN